MGSGDAESRRESRAVARATEALSLDIKSASASALRAAKESGSVAGMLAKDVAASRVDAREAFDLLAGLLAETDEKTARRDGETKDEVAFELGVVAESVGNLEKSLLAKLKSTNDVVSVESSDSNTSSATSSKTNESAKTREEEEASSELTARSLDTLARAAIAAEAAASAADRAAAAAEKASSSASSFQKNDDAYDNARDRYPRDPVVAKLDAEQWSLLGARLTQLEEAAGEAVGRVRAGVREDIRGASDALAAAAEAAVETPKTGGTRRRRLGRDEDDLDSKKDKNDLSGVSKPSSDDTSTGEEASPFGLPFEFAERVAVPASFSKAAAASAFGRIAAEAAMREDSKERLEGRSRDGDGLPPINAAVGLTKEAAFQNMQALLREKSDETGSDETPEDAEEEEEEKEEEDWSARPVRVSLATGRDGRVVATLATRGEKGAESSVDEIEPSTPTDSSGFATDDGTSRETELARLAVGGDEENAEENAPRDVFVSARARLDEGLTSLRAARLAARDAGSNPTRMLEADADAAAAVANLEAAAEAFDRLASDANDAGPNENDERTIFAGAAAARGNLGNALLARGRLQVRLSSMAASQERRASLAGVRAGAEGAAAFHAEIAEECLVLAGRAFRKTLASRDPFKGSERDSDLDSEREMPKRNAEKRSAGAARALTGWGAALALRGDAALASASRRRDASLASRTRENKNENNVTDADVAYAVSASEAAALAAAASEKYRAALELDASSDSDSENDESRFVFTAETRARAFTDWGDALRLAARAAASALAATSGPGFEPGRGQEFESVFDAARLPPPGECWARAEACYEEALRWDAEGCGEDARRGLRACAEAFR